MSNDCYVFTGPSLPPDEAGAVLDAVYLPPVAQGDVYRVALKRPRAIGIIDGYFERIPAVWHKEILWAMAQGIHVFGSASMGALRAVELEPFGMEGVGAIYEAFLAGELEDDDEVAVTHGPAETDYRVGSEAMVNIRFTLARAQAEQVISAGTLSALGGVAKGLFYTERSYPELLRRGLAFGLSKGQLDALRAWLPGGQVNQKRDDAIRMLEVIRDRLAEGLAPKQVSYVVENTRIWNLVRSVPGALDGAAAVQPTALLEELGVEGSYQRVLRGALARFLAVTEAARQNLVISGEQIQDTGDRWRDERGLVDLSAFERWLSEHDVSLERFSRMVREEAIQRLLESWAAPEVASRIVDELHARGEYDRLLARARDKQRVLESCGLDNPELSDTGLTWDALLSWYFRERQGRPVPASLERYATDGGFGDEVGLRRAVLREYCYSAAVT